jgi:hypothetical protein
MHELYLLNHAQERLKLELLEPYASRQAIARTGHRSDWIDSSPHPAYHRHDSFGLGQCVVPSWTNFVLGQVKERTMQAVSAPVRGVGCGGGFTGTARGRQTGFG